MYWPPRLLLELISVCHCELMQLSAKVLNEMIRLNWEGGGLTGFL